MPQPCLTNTQQPDTLPTVLREAVQAEINRRGWSVRKLSTESGVTLSRVQTFLKADPSTKRSGGLTSDNLDRILATLGLRLCRDRARRPAR